MKIMLKRKVELKSAVVYLKMQTQARREDIKNYLESGPFSNSVIERRVKKYLGGRGIYNNQNQLTVEGQKIRETVLLKNPKKVNIKYGILKTIPSLETEYFILGV